MADWRLAHLPAQVLGASQRRLDFRIKLGLVIIIKTQRGMDLSQRKMRMLEVDFFRTPAVRDHIQSDFADFGVGVIDPGGAAAIQPDMRRRESLHREVSVGVALVESNSLDDEKLMPLGPAFFTRTFQFMQKTRPAFTA